MGQIKAVSVFHAQYTTLIQKYHKIMHSSNWQQGMRNDDLLITLSRQKNLFGLLYTWSSSPVCTSKSSIFAISYLCTYVNVFPAQSRFMLHIRKKNRWKFKTNKTELNNYTWSFYSIVTTRLSFPVGTHLTCSSFSSIFLWSTLRHLVKSVWSWSGVEIRSQPYMLKTEKVKNK